MPVVPVPQTDTGGWGENPKASGTMFVKELGKTAGVPSVYALPFCMLGNEKLEDSLTERQGN